MLGLTLVAMATLYIAILAGDRSLLVAQQIGDLTLLYLVIILRLLLNIMSSSSGRQRRLHGRIGGCNRRNGLYIAVSTRIIRRVMLEKRVVLGVVELQILALRTSSSIVIARAQRLVIIARIACIVGVVGHIGVA